MKVAIKTRLLPKNRRAMSRVELPGTYLLVFLGLMENI